MSPKETRRTVTDVHAGNGIKVRTWDDVAGERTRKVTYYRRHEADAVIVQLRRRIYELESRLASDITASPGSHSETPPN